MFKKVGKCHQKVKKIVFAQDTFHNLYIYYIHIYMDVFECFFSLSRLSPFPAYEWTVNTSVSTLSFVPLVLFDFFLFSFLSFSLFFTQTFIRPVSMMMLAIFRAMQTDSTCIQNENARSTPRAFSHIFLCLFLVCFAGSHCCCCCCFVVGAAAALSAFSVFFLFLFLLVSLVSRPENKNKNSTFAVNKDRLLSGWASKFAIILACAALFVS